MAHIRCKRISKWLEELACEPQGEKGEPLNKLIAEQLKRLAIGPDTPDKLRLEAIREILDRTEGKSIQTNVNADVGPSPLADIPTETLEALRKKAEEMKNAK